MESKWLYNWLVTDISRLKIDTKEIKKIEIKVGETFEERDLTVLGSQIKQDIADRLKDNLRALVKLKEGKHKVGQLKHKKFVNSIPLKQYGVTYKLDPARNRIRIQRLGEFRVLGLHQIPSEAEIANAVLVRKPSGYYIHVTCYLPDDYFERSSSNDDMVAVDGGIRKKLTLSNGAQIDFEVSENKRIKRLQKRLAKKEKRSKNRLKTRRLLRIEYEDLKNKKKRRTQQDSSSFKTLQKSSASGRSCGWLGGSLRQAGSLFRDRGTSHEVAEQPQRPNHREEV